MDIYRNFFLKSGKKVENVFICTFKERCCFYPWQSRYSYFCILVVLYRASQSRFCSLGFNICFKYYYLTSTLKKPNIIVYTMSFWCVIVMYSYIIHEVFLHHSWIISQLIWQYNAAFKFYQAHLCFCWHFKLHFTIL